MYADNVYKIHYITQQIKNNDESQGREGNRKNKQIRKEMEDQDEWRKIKNYSWLK